MSPNPVSKIRRDAVVYLGPFEGVHTIDDEIVRLVCDIIATWTYIESDMKSLAAGALHANALAVSEILSGVRNSRFRNSLIEAAAREALSAEHFRLFDRVMAVVRPVGKARHDFAHHIWGALAGDPTRLVLIDPEDFDRAHANITARRSSFLSEVEEEEPIAEVAGIKMYAPRPSLVHPDKMMAWTRDEIAAIWDQALKAHILVRALEIVIHPGPALPGQRPPDETALSVLSEHLPPERLPNNQSL